MPEIISALRRMHDGMAEIRLRSSVQDGGVPKSAPKIVPRPGAELDHTFWPGGALACRRGTVFVQAPFPCAGLESPTPLRLRMPTTGRRWASAECLSLSHGPRGRVRDCRCRLRSGRLLSLA